MLIRNEQMQALSLVPEEAFQLQLVEEMRQFAPWHAQILGDSGLLRCVEFAKRRAASYGFTNRGPIRLYLQMIFLLGADFDSDPLLPWAAAALSTPSTADQTARATSLYRALDHYIQHVAGPANSFAKQALARAHVELSTSPGDDEKFSDEIIFDTLRRVYPEKCDYAGESAVRQSIQLGKAAAERHSTNGQGVVLFCGLIFALGHGFETDPHLPWIGKTLNEPGLTGSRLVQRLSSRVKTYLDQVIANVG